MENCKKACETGEIQIWHSIFLHLAKALSGDECSFYSSARASPTGTLRIGMRQCCYFQFNFFFANLYRYLILVLETANTHRTLWVILWTTKNENITSQIRIQSKSDAGCFLQYWHFCEMQSGCVIHNFLFCFEIYIAFDVDQSTDYIYVCVQRHEVSKIECSLPISFRLTSILMCPVRRMLTSFSFEVSVFMPQTLDGKCHLLYFNLSIIYFSYKLHNELWWIWFFV